MAKKHNWFLLLCISFAVVSLTLLTQVATAVTQASKGLPESQVADLYMPVILRFHTPTPACIPPETIPPDDAANEQSIANSINSIRTANGLTSLTLVSKITQAARRHSRDMADNNFTSHTGSDGTSGGQRMEAACYDWSGWGEIIGWGFGGSTSEMINWWMNSPPHKSLILSDYFEDFGVGYARNAGSTWGHYWTVNFGTRGDSYHLSSQGALYTCEYIYQDQSGGSMLILHTNEPCP